MPSALLVRPWTYFLGVFLAASCTTALVLGFGGTTKSTPDRATGAVDPLKLPLVFEANGGRTDEHVRFMARGSGSTLFFTDAGTVLKFRGRGGRSGVVRTRLVGGAAAPTLDGERPVGGKINSLIGNDPGKWRRGIDAFRELRYRSVYPGVDLLYHGRNGALEYDFVVAPGAKPTAPRLRIDGARLSLAASGDLVLRAAAGTLRHLKPVAYQTIGGKRRPIDARFDLSGRDVSFRVGRYDRRHPLVIDPVLSYSTYLGGTSAEQGGAIDVDADGNAWVTGSTYSTDFPKTQGSYGSSKTTSDQDVYITKIAPDGKSFLYSTYIGGGGGDGSAEIAVDDTGSAYVAGSTTGGFPMVNAEDDSHNGDHDIFVLRLNAAGDDLVFSTYIGSTNTDQGFGLGLDSSGVYVAGVAGAGIETEGNSFDADNNGNLDAFFAKLDPTGFMLYSTYLGGSGTDLARDVEVDPSTGDAHVVGDTNCDADPCTTPFPTGGTLGTPHQTVHNNNGGSIGGVPGEARFDVFVTVIDPDASTAPGSLKYSTLLGGQGNDFASGVETTAHDTFVVGSTTSSQAPIADADKFPLKGASLDTTFGGTDEGFVVKLWHSAPSAASAISYSTYIGGNDRDNVADLVANNEGVFLVGTTHSSDFELKNSAYSHSGQGDADAFVMKFLFDAFGSDIVFSTVLGGAGGADSGADLEADTLGHVWLTGLVGLNGSGFPVTPGAAQTTSYTGTHDDAYVAKLSIPPVTISSGPSGPTSDSTPTFVFSAGDTGNSYGCRIDGDGPAPGNGFVFSGCTPTGFTVGAPLPDGPHHFDVFTQDLAGTEDGTFTRRDFVVDTQPPTAPVLESPADGAGVAEVTPAFTWKPATDTSTSVQDYDFTLDGKTTTVGASACSAGTCSFTPSDVLADGPHSWSVGARDVLGHTGSTSSATFTVAVPPTAAIVVSPNPALIGSSINFDASGSSDPGGSIARFEWDLDGDGSFEVDTGATKSTSRTYPTAGDYTVAVRVTDGSGLQATASTSLRVNLAPGATAQFGVSINSGAQFTNTPDVKLRLVGPLSTTSILVSNDGGFANPTSFLPASEVSWKLDSSGPERLPKTVYARFLPQLTQGLTFTDDIILDEIPPKVVTAALRGGTTTSSQASTARLKKFRLKVKATDSNSGVQYVQVTTNKRKPGRLVKYRRTLTVRSAKKPRFVRARDRAKNFSRWRKLR